ALGWEVTQRRTLTGSLRDDRDHSGHRPGQIQERTFSVSLSEGVFCCFDGRCSKRGDVIDLWTAVRQLSLREAALDLAKAAEKRHGGRARLGGPQQPDLPPQAGPVRLRLQATPRGKKQPVITDDGT